MYAAIWLSRRTNTRSIPAMVFIAIAVVGALMMVCIPATNANPRYAGYVLIFSWPSTSPSRVFSLFASRC